MERTYYNGDRERTVEEVEGVVAVLPEAQSDGSRSAAEEGPADVAQRFGQNAPASAIKGPKRGARSANNDTPNEGGRDAFEQAGWVFVQPSDEVRGALEAGNEVAGAEIVGKVYQQSGGRLLVETQRLTVRLSDELTEAEAEQILSYSGVLIEKKLKFAPNLYEVSVGGGRDSISVSVEPQPQGCFC